MLSRNIIDQLLAKRIVPVNKIGTSLLFAIVGIAVWLLLSQSIEPLELGIAAVVSLLLGFVFSFFVVLPFKLLNPVRWFWFLVYLPWFLLQMVKANLQVAAIVVNPALPLNPAIVKGKTTLKSNLGRLLLTSSITLTPGTLSVDINDSEVEIHCVDSTAGDAAGIMQPFEKFIRRITE
jgi:multicomponent Na+:H+ antiporter subunit E